MNLLFISDSNLSLGLAMRCESEGHNVRFATTASSAGQGIVKLASQDEEWSPDIAVYDNNKFTQHADSARSNGLKTLGPSRWSSLLESDENYRNQIIASLGWPLAGAMQGTHLYISAWFNGASFVSTYTSISYRRFMPGGAGPDLTCTGMIGNFKGLTDKTFQTFVAPLEKMLKKVNHRGCVHIHAVVDGDKFAVKDICASFMHPLSLLLYENSNLTTSNILLHLLDETSKPIFTIAPWACGAQISLPPYPHGELTDRKQIKGIIPANLKHIWLADVSMEDNSYYATNNGLVGYVTARGADENECVRRMYRTIGNINTTDLQFRNDIGRHLQSLLTALRSPGWLS